MEEIKALTDLGNADRFIEQHKQDSRYSPEQKKWLHWNGIQWIIDENGEVFQKAKHDRRDDRSRGQTGRGR